MLYRCCNCADEPATNQSICSNIYHALYEWINYRIQVQKNGITIARQFLPSKSSASKYIKSYAKSANQAAQAAQEYVSEYRYMVHKTQQGTQKIQQQSLSIDAIRALERSKGLAQYASFQFALLDSLAVTDFGTNFKLLPLLLGDCASSPPLSDKIVRGGSTTVIPKEYIYTVCPFRNISQIQTNHQHWKQLEASSKGDVIDTEETNVANSGTMLGYWMGDYRQSSTLYSQWLKQEHHTLHTKTIDDSKDTKISIVDTILRRFTVAATEPDPNEMNDSYTPRLEFNVSKFDNIASIDTFLQSFGVLDYTSATLEQITHTSIPKAKRVYDRQRRNEPGKYKRPKAGSHTSSVIYEGLETIYEDGEPCNDHIRRSVRVRWVCDDGTMSTRFQHVSKDNSADSSPEHLRILDVREDGTCSYHMTVGTPFVCTSGTIKILESAAVRISMLK